MNLQKDLKGVSEEIPKMILEIPKMILEGVQKTHLESQTTFLKESQIQ